MSFNTIPIHGKVCRVEKSDVLMLFTDGWEANFECDFDDTTSQGEDWEDQIAGCARWRGSISGKFVPGNTEHKALYDNIITATPGTKLTDVQFNLDVATNAFTGDIHILSVNVRAAREGKVTVTINFKGSGAPALSDAA